LYRINTLSIRISNRIEQKSNDFPINSNYNNETDMNNSYFNNFKDRP